MELKYQGGLTINKQALINQLVSMRAAIDACLFLLQEEEINDECNHPEQHRLNLTTMGGKEHWSCKVCGYEYIEREE